MCTDIQRRALPEKICGPRPYKCDDNKDDARLHIECIPKFEH